MKVPVTWLRDYVDFEGSIEDLTKALTFAGIEVEGVDTVGSDYADMVARLLPLSARGRTVVVLEGGYDLDAVAACSGAVVAELIGESHRPEAATSGGPGAEVVRAAASLVAAPSSG